MKWKQLAGGGSLKMFNRLALEGLRSLGYPEDFVNEAALEVAGLDGLISAFQGNMDSVVNQLIVDPCNDQAGPVRLPRGAACLRHGIPQKFRKKWPISATRPTWPC